MIVVEGEDRELLIGQLVATLLLVVDAASEPVEVADSYDS